MSPIQFHDQVMSVLIRDGFDSAISESELALIAYAIDSGVGPNDCAYQIQDNRTPENGESAA